MKPSTTEVDRELVELDEELQHAYARIETIRADRKSISESTGRLNELFRPRAGEASW